METQKHKMDTTGIKSNQVRYKKLISAQLVVSEIKQSTSAIEVSKWLVWRCMVKLPVLKFLFQSRQEDIGIIIITLLLLYVLRLSSASHICINKH